MKDFEYHHLVVQICNGNETDRAKVAAVKAEAWRRIRTPIVFDRSAPGYLRIGAEGQELELPDPGLEGLGDAWLILLHGPTAKHALRATYFAPSPNALRNRLAKAAQWIDKTAKCRELAQALRRPYLVISDDGTITVNPQRGVHIKII